MSIDQYKNACFHDYVCSGPDNTNKNNDMRSCEGGRWENKRPICHRKEPWKKEKTPIESIGFDPPTRRWKCQ